MFCIYKSKEAPMSFKKCIPKITSPDTSPLYSLILCPSIEGVVVKIISLCYFMFPTDGILPLHTSSVQSYGFFLIYAKLFHNLHRF